jgi:hypothetical protein
MNPRPQRIPVMIAVAIDGNGFWSAAGNSAYASKVEASEAALDYLPEESKLPRQVVWITADVPLPLREIVQGIAGIASSVP